MTFFCTVSAAWILASPSLPAAQTTIPPADQQITSVVLPLPADLRSGATVLGYGADGKLGVVLRKGTGDMTCLASDPKEQRFHAACYHNDMEPFMARGRALRTDKDARVRYRAAVALGAMGREAQAAVGALHQAAEDSSAEVRRAASEALEQIERDKFQP